MSDALYKLGGLRFWNEQEIELREMFTTRCISTVKRTLNTINPSWQFARLEGPCLSPKGYISGSYDDDDVFCTNHVAGGGNLYLRAETTPSSYAYAKFLNKRPPLCVYQSGKSFRRENNDGANASKLRFNEFYQLEFQCIYSNDTKADYRSSLIKEVSKEIERFTMVKTRVVESDRLPAYSESTLDIECEYNNGWKEVASCSIRKDYSDAMRVCEIAIGLDRVVSIGGI
jgi:glycyl-tRNA synthetase